LEPFLIGNLSKVDKRRLWSGQKLEVGVSSMRGEGGEVQKTCLYSSGGIMSNGIVAVEGEKRAVTRRENKWGGEGPGV